MEEKKPFVDTVPPEVQKAVEVVVKVGLGISCVVVNGEGELAVFGNLEAPFEAYVWDKIKLGKLLGTPPYAVQLIGGKPN